MNQGPPRRAWLAWIAVLAPALLLLLYGVVYAVNGPHWDHVTSAEIFDRWDRGDFTLRFLFQQHNEHRIAAPRLVTLALGELTRWNTKHEVVAHWGLMCATAAILFAAFRREAAPMAAGAPALLLFAPAAGLLLSPRSYQALFGDGFPHYLSILGFAGALVLLAPLNFRLKAEATRGKQAEASRLVGAIACGLVASFSIANGLVVWPLGLLVLLSAWRVDPAAFRWSRAAIWSAAGAATIAGYFYGYTDPGNHTSPRVPIERPFVALGHYLALNGSPLAPDARGALVFGAIVVALDAIVLWRVFDDWRGRRLPPPLGTWLIVLVLVSCAMITLNRAGFGMVQALESRYTALTALAPVGVYWCAVARRAAWPRPGVTIAAIATLALTGYVAASVHAWTIGPAWHSERAWRAYLLYSAKYQPPALLLQLFPNADDARRYSAMVERLGYSVFAEERVKPETLARNAPQPGYIVEAVNGKPTDTTQPVEVRSGDAVVVTGWTFDDRNAGPARAVFLTIDGTRDFPAHVGIYRPGLCGTIERRARCWAGLKGSVGGFLLEPGEHSVALTIVADDGRRAFVSEPVARIVRR